MSSRVPFFPDAGARPSHGDVLRPERVPSSPCNTISLLFLGPATRGAVTWPASKKSSVPAPPWPSPRDKFSVTVTAVGSRDEAPSPPVRAGPASSRSPMEPGRVLRGEAPENMHVSPPGASAGRAPGFFALPAFRGSVSPEESSRLRTSLPVVPSCGHFLWSLPPFEHPPRDSAPAAFHRKGSRYFNIPNIPDNFVLKNYTTEQICL